MKDRWELRKEDLGSINISYNNKSVMFQNRQDHVQTKIKGPLVVHILIELPYLRLFDLFKVSATTNLKFFVNKVSILMLYKKYCQDATPGMRMKL